MKWLFPKYIWKMGEKSKTIYLTFDDGPIPIVTEFVLDMLEKYNAKATFFCIGENVKNHPEIYKRIIANGHSIGNHTYNHLRGWDTDNEQYINNFISCDEEMGVTKYFRPPYGRIKKKQAEIILKTHKIIMWDVLSGDFSKDISPEICLQKSINYTSPGAIVLFHDSLKAFENMAYTLPKYIAHFKEKGYEFEAIKN